MRRLYNFSSRFEDFKGLTTHSATLYCACGYPIFVREVMGSGVTERSFFDYSAEDRPLELCPHCGVDLGAATLSARVPKHIRDL